MTTQSMGMNLKDVVVKSNENESLFTRAHSDDLNSFESSASIRTMPMMKRMETMADLNDEVRMKNAMEFYFSLPTMAYPRDAINEKKKVDNVGISANR